MLQSLEMNAKLVLPPDYVREATALVEKAERQVSLISMVVADHEATHSLIDALQSAAERGVKVTVSADIFTYGEVNGSFLPLRYNSLQSKEATKMAKRLKKAGVRFEWLGHGRVTLLNGRTHSKWCVIDDTVFTFGGVNMYQGGIENTDYMFEVNNAELADRLVREQKRIQSAERTATNFSSTSFELDGNNRALFDGGIIGQSIIYRRICALTEKAEHVLFVSQYCPTSKLSRLLKKTPHTLYFNQPEQASFLNKILIRTSMFFTRFTSSYQRKNYLHAKFMVFTMKDGSKIAITGSHNFAYTGVLFGTREIALETKDPAVISQLEAFAKTHVF